WTLKTAATSFTVPQVGSPPLPLPPSPPFPPRCGPSAAAAAAQRQGDEGAAVALADHAHQGRELRGGQELADDLVVDRERDRMDPHGPLTVLVRAVRAVDLAHDRVDRPLREVVAVHVQRDLLA